MDKWEYLYVNFMESTGPGTVSNVNGQRMEPPVQAAEYLNALGNQGWELVGTLPFGNVTLGVYGVLFFKRRKP